MRLRNVKNAKEIVNNHPLIVKENPFDNNKTLYIEIGTGKGDFIIGLSQKYPNINFIGIEKYESVLIRALEKAPNDIKNLRFMCLDALALEEILKSSVDKIYLNFSDPWPKKRHAKRRLTSPLFLNLYEKISRRDVNIEMKTDNKGLFAYSLETFNNNGYIFNEVSLDLPRSENNIETEYERKFREKGITINYLSVTKKMK